MYDHLTRPYAMAIGGDVDTTILDGSALTLTFHEHPGVPAMHDIYWNRGTPSVTCDGRRLDGVVGDPGRLVFRVTCGGSQDPAGVHTLLFR